MPRCEYSYYVIFLPFNQFYRGNTGGITGEPCPQPPP